MTSDEAKFLAQVAYAIKYRPFHKVYAYCAVLSQPAPAGFHRTVGLMLEDEIPKTLASAIRKVIAKVLRLRKTYGEIPAITSTVGTLDGYANSLHAAERGQPDDAGRLLKWFVTYLRIAHAYQQLGVYGEPEAIAAAVVKALRGHGVSRTDVLRAVRTYCEHVPFDDWLRTV